MDLQRKSIMIFGGGLNQLELIKSAKDLGIISVVVDPMSDPPGKGLADYFYQVAGNDYDRTKAIAIKHKVDGIVTGQTEKPMSLMAKLAQELKLVFHTPEVVQKSLDKWMMKQAFIKNHVPCAKGVLVGDGSIVSENLLEGLNPPFIIKPKDATSSQGVFKIDTYRDISRYIDNSRSFSKTGEIIIEEYLDGPEYSVESITFKGITTIVQYTEKFITLFPNTVEMGHLQPAQLTDTDRANISMLVVNAIDAIGIDNSASHAELKLTSEGPKMVEIGARLGGDFISSYLTQESCGVSMDKASIQIALSMIPDINAEFSHFSYIRYIELPIGKRIKKILPYEDILKHSDLIIAYISVREGSVVTKINQSSDRPGWVLVRDSFSREKAISKGIYVAELLKSKIIFD